MANDLQFWGGDVLFSADGLLAMHADCCCGGQECEYCTDEVQGAILTVIGLNADGLSSPDPTCCCEEMNGDWFVPANPNAPAYGCWGNRRIEDLMTCEGYDYDVIVNYNIFIGGNGNIWLNGYVSVWDKFGPDQVGYIAGECDTGVSPPSACKGLVCDDTDPFILYCDNSGAEITIRIV